MWKFAQILLSVFLITSVPAGAADCNYSLLSTSRLRAELLNLCRRAQRPTHDRGPSPVYDELLKAAKELMARMGSDRDLDVNLALEILRRRTDSTKGGHPSSEAGEVGPPEFFYRFETRNLNDAAARIFKGAAAHVHFSPKWNGLYVTVLFVQVRPEYAAYFRLIYSGRVFVSAGASAIRLSKELIEDLLREPWTGEPGEEPVYHAVFVNSPQDRSLQGNEAAGRNEGSNFLKLIQIGIGGPVLRELLDVAKAPLDLRKEFDGLGE